MSMIDLIDEVEELKKQTKFYSSVQSMRETEAYKNILKLGKDAIRPLMNQIFDAPVPIMALLEDITGEVPYSASDRGKVFKMVDAWILWNQRRKKES